MELSSRNIMQRNVVQRQFGLIDKQIFLLTELEKKFTERKKKVLIYNRRFTDNPLLNRRQTDPKQYFFVQTIN